MPKMCRYWRRAGGACGAGYQQGEGCRGPAQREKGRVAHGQAAQQKVKAGRMTLKKAMLIGDATTRVTLSVSFRVSSAEEG